ncbi:NAD synthetase [Carbonactinospora thermoautotrophica]|uniref:Glutamine-dependent NAD(+) synthetase n=2 Tax=Carbonactinospora thermoautotrophica TaxID=1469144 RepID=A0A132MVQ0_9ACTN|nr:NAD+ synthase [Carbonactinospora thermoautotrophica]KWX01770.1 NAD synthetase [Carbonactinospora thermoautotrophica]
MAQLRLALNQVDFTVGDIEGNAEKILRWTRHAADRGAHLVVFPEMALTGYPVEDLALRRSFVEASRAALDRLAGRLADAGLGETLVAVGYLDGAPDAVPRLGKPAGSPLNAAAFLHGGRVVARYAKHHLPNYGVFDEFRYFVPGDTLHVVRHHGVDVALTICEDLWQDGGPVAAARTAGTGLLLVINGSPYELNKDDVRLDLVRKRASEAGCTLAYVNLVGGQDELVFDGDSIVVSSDGDVLARAPQFEEGCLLVDLDLPAASDGARPDRHTEPDGGVIAIEWHVLSGEPLPAYEPIQAGVADRLCDEAEVYTALVTGLRDYVVKNGFKTVILGLSGGIDSALAAAVACDAIGARNVYGISMPSEYSSQHSVEDAAELARRTGLNYRVVPIAPMVRVFLDHLHLTGVAQENLQARVRGMTLMGLSNQHGHLVLATGNKSELAVGYSTLYGDAVGGFAPLKDVPKTLVWRLARWRNEVARQRGETPPIPERSITKPPSAELRPGQLDTDSLPPYELLDDVLDDYVEQDKGLRELIAAGFDTALVERVIALVDRAEYKRRQYPPGPKITLKAFGRDRRLPITNRWHEVAPGHAAPEPPEVLAESGVPGGDDRAGEHPARQES